MEVADAGWDGNTDIRWGKKLNNLIDGHRDMDEDLFGWPPLFFGTNVYFFRLEELTENDVSLSLKTNISRNIVVFDRQSCPNFCFFSDQIDLGGF